MKTELESIIKVKDLEVRIQLEKMEDIFDIDFGGVMLQFTKTGNKLKVTNGVDGYGRNVKSEYENEPVIIESAIKKEDTK